MATPQSLEEIIRKECLPLRDCMLTITDAGGEAAFLYFKEGELIEANYAALWGKEALAQIVTWKLADGTVAPLPLGIKRSLCLIPASPPPPAASCPAGRGLFSMRRNRRPQAPLTASRPSPGCSR